MFGEYDFVVGVLVSLGCCLMSMMVLMIVVGVDGLWFVVGSVGFVWLCGVIM